MPQKLVEALKDKDVFYTGFYNANKSGIGFVAVLKKNVVKVYDALGKRREIIELEVKPVKGPLKDDVFTLLLWSDGKVEVPPPLSKWMVFWKALKGLFA